MAILQAILLGIIEGLTEFLPISSTGHLVVAERLIGYKDAAELFTVVIQVGAIAAVIWHFRQDLITKVKGLLSGDKKTVRFWGNWIAATIPAGIAGLLLDEELGKFATPKTVAISLIIGGVVIWLIENNHRSKAHLKNLTKPDFDGLSLWQAVQVGFYQILSLVPGVSRSGATIMGGLVSGLDRVTATAFSFYLSIPVIVLASGYKLVKNGDQIANISGGAPALIVGTVVSFISALAVVNWLLKYVSRNDFKPFAYYRIILGIIILIALTLS